jgi:hypothetical protein
MSQGRRSAGPLPAAGRGQGLVQRACCNHELMVQGEGSIAAGAGQPGFAGAGRAPARAKGPQAKTTTPDPRVA